MRFFFCFQDDGSIAYPIELTEVFETCELLVSLLDELDDNQLSAISECLQSSALAQGIITTVGNAQSLSVSVSFSLSLFLSLSLCLSLSLSVCVCVCVCIQMAYRPISGELLTNSYINGNVKKMRNNNNCKPCTMFRSISISIKDTLDRAKLYT